jgi:DNA-binding GntR family transcriptional regulator
MDSNNTDVAFRTLQRRNFSDEVADQLRNSILSLELPPKTVLRQEEIAAKLGISRTPVRQAFTALMQEGWLEPLAASGSVEVVELKDADAKDLYEVRAPLDGLAARLCAERVDQLPMAELEQTLNELEAAAHPFDVRRFTDAHVNFHVSLVNASGNKRLVQTLFIVKLSMLMLSPKHIERPERMIESAREHRRILDTIKTGDGDAAERVAVAHIQSAEHFWFGT